MTAEMVIMNRSAVALAADSAVTIARPDTDGQPGVRKIYANANKLFELIRGRPVGMLIYDSADLVQVPWETLVKRYRNAHKGLSFDTLPGYADSFCQYLNSEIERLIPDDLRNMYVHYCVHVAARDFLGIAEERIQSKATEGGIRVNNDLRKSTLEELLNELDAEIGTDDLAPWTQGVDEDDLFRRYGSDSLSLVPDTLQNFRLLQGHKKKICKLAYAFALRRGITPTTTGVAIVGFGEHDTFPSMVHLLIGGVIDDKLVAYDREEVSVSATRQSHLIPLAQINEATTFLFGIDPAVKDQISAFWGKWLSKLGETAASIAQKELPKLEAEKLATLQARFQKYGDASWQEFAKFMNRLHVDLRYGPIESSAAFLSKGELAGLAENLVDLASLRNRVSIDRAETVGGATDVAVVSPGDGFVWIKRKHYFSLDLNPNWPSRQLGSAVD